MQINAELQKKILKLEKELEEKNSEGVKAFVTQTEEDKKDD